ncbi:MAG: DUF2085 domain-containing protein [Candidatus Micrarchaeota archaeon]|nr:DUF2085 domain-containing protein [Candidatus Micrarchaeota archaeon]
MKFNLGTKEKLIIAIALVNLIILLPLVAVPLYYNNSLAAAIVYNVYGPTCHQYIERSLCFFNSNNSWSLGECIENTSAHPIVKTLYTMSKLNYSGPFFYDKANIGADRSEAVYYDGKTGYKMPACSRDFGIYLGAFIGIILFVIIGKRFGVVSLPVYLVFLVPLVIDGFAQLLLNYESTNLIRVMTGLIAGSASTIALLSLMFNK